MRDLAQVIRGVVFLKTILIIVILLIFFGC